MYRQVLPLPGRRELQEEYEQHAVVLEKALHEVQRRIRRTVELQGLRPTMKYRIKSFDSFYEKLLRRSRDLAPGDEVEITDLLGVRVVCPFVEDISHAVDTVQEAFEVTEVEKKGADLATTEFGYSSVHLLTRLPGDICDSFHLSGGWLCEVQLRTILQDAWAEVEHELVYKAELTPLDGKLRRKLSALNANLTLSDIIFQEIRDYQRALQSKLMRRREGFWADLNATDPVGAASRAESEDDSLRTGSDTIDSMLIKALHAHNQKDYAGAIRLYTDILAYQPESHVAAIIHSHRGMARFAVGDGIGAIDDFTSTIELSPQTVRAYYYRGVVYRHQERYQTALEDFTRCLEFDPYHVDARIARARLNLHLGDVAAAREDCFALEEIEPDHPEIVRLCNEIRTKLEQNDDTTVRE